MKTYIFLLAAIWSICGVSGLDYYLAAQVKLNLGNVERISMVGDKLAVVSSDSVFTLFNGTNYSNRQVQYQCNAEPYNIKVNQQGVFINSGAFVTRRYLTESISKFEERGLWSNMLLLPNFALFSQAAPVPKLKKLNFATMQIEEVTYDYKGEGLGLKKVLNQAGEGDIMFGFEKALLILDRYSLSVKQLVQTKHPIEHITSYYDTYNNQVTTYIGQKIPQGLQWHRLVYTPGTYQIVPSFITTEAKTLELSSPIAGVVLENGNIHYYQNTSSIVRMGFQATEFVDRGKLMVVGHNQSFMVVEYTAGLAKYYWIYQIASDLRVRKSRELVIQSSYLSGGKTQMTLNDNYMFIEHKNDTRFNVAIVNMDTLDYTLIEEDQAVANNILDFHVFVNYQSTDIALYVALAISADSNQVYFELREGKSKIINKVLANQNKASSLLGSRYWGNCFLLVQKLQEIASRVSVFVAQDYQQIQSLQTSAQFRPIHEFFACGQYLLAWQLQTKIIKVHSFVNLTQIGKIEIAVERSEIQINQNILILHQTVLRKKSVYDLSRGIDYRGAVFLEYFNIQQLPIYAILPQRGLLYQAPPYQSESQSPSKVFYNIRQPSLLRTVQMQTFERVRLHPLYYLHSTDSGPCNWVFYTELYQGYWRIARYSQCDKTIRRYQLGSSTAIYQCKLFISTDSVFLIIIYNLQRSKESKVEVRRISDLNAVLFDQFFTVTDTSYVGDVYDADVLNSTTLIVHYYDAVYAANLHAQLFAQDLELESIRTLDIDSKYDVIAVAGLQRDFFLVKKLIVSNFLGSTVYLNERMDSMAVILELSPSYLYLASYHQDFQLKIWQISKKKIINTSYIPDIQRLKFIDTHLLLIQFSSHYSILNVTSLTFIHQTTTPSIQPKFKSYQSQPINSQPPQPINHQKGQLKSELLQSIKQQAKLINQAARLSVQVQTGNQRWQAYNYQTRASNYQTQAKYQVQASQDGNIFAEITAPQEVLITANSTTATFKAPLKNETIISLSFVNADHLLVATDLGTLYLLKPGKCAQNYVNQDLNCVCVSPFVESQGKCVQDQPGFPGWAIVLIVLGSIMLVLGGVWAYRQRKMKRRISLLQSQAD